MKRLGAYELRGELARGAFGVVFRAHDPALDRPIALKVIRSEDVRDPESQQRFLREVRILARLRHPHVIGVHSAGLADHGYPYLAMDLIEGGSLRDRLAEVGTLPIDEAVRLGIQLADALAYAHAQGVLHRDIKPHNVLLDGDNAILTDFGLAKLLGADAEGLTLSGERLGTPAYMAPEQVRGDHDLIGPATDVYGLGATLYQMVSGQLPFPGTSVVEVFDRIRTHPASSVRLLRPEVDPELEGIIQTCLAKTPADRFPSATALRSALEGWRAARDPNASARTLRTAVAPRGRAGRRWVLLAAAIALVVGWVSAFPLERAVRREVYRRELPDALLARHMRGVERYIRDDFEGALEDLNHVIAEAPNCTAAYYRRARILQGLKRNADAHADILRALEIDPEFAQGYNLRAQVRPKEEHVEALADYDRAIELDPLNAVWYHNRAGVHYNQGRDAEALQDLERSLQLDPRFGQAYLLRGSIKKRGDDPKGALADFDQGLVCEPNSVELLNARGMLRSKQGDQVGASADFTAAIIASIEKPVYHANRAHTFEKRDEWLAALADYTTAIEINPKHESAYRARSLIYLRLRRWADGAADMERAAALQAKESDREGLLKAARAIRKALAKRIYAVEAKTVEIREGPDQAFPRMGTLLKGARATLLQETRGWAKIQVQSPDGRTHVGFVPAKSLAILIDNNPD